MIFLPKINNIKCKLNLYNESSEFTSSHLVVKCEGRSRRLDQRGQHLRGVQRTGQKVTMLNAHTGEELWTVQESLVWSMSISADGPKWCAAGDNKVSMLNARTGEEVTVQREVWSSRRRSARRCPRGVRRRRQECVHVGRAYGRGGVDGAFEYRSPQRQSARTAHVVCGGWDNKVSMLDARTGEELWTVQCEGLSRQRRSALTAPTWCAAVTTTRYPC